LQNFSCTPPLPSVPLWEPDFTPGPLSTYTCYVQSSVPRSNFSLSCHTNLTIAEQLASPLGLYFWCHNTLHSCITHATPGPYTLVVIVPQLTLYGEAEFSLLFGAQPKHAAFLPIMVSISLMTSVVAAGFLGGALGHSFITAKHFEDRLQITLESTSASLASLQRQLTSLAQVALQNCRALDLLTAEKGGTCSSSSGRNVATMSISLGL
jgi:hypothetical protein